MNFTTELSDQLPHLSEPVNKGFVNFKSMLNRLLKEEQAATMLKGYIDTSEVVEVIFSGPLGACVQCTADKSKKNLDYTISTLIEYSNRIRK